MMHGRKNIKFVIEVVCVCDYRCLAFVNAGNYGVFAGDFLVDLFWNMQLCLMCGVLVVGVV